MDQNTRRRHLFTRQGHLTELSAERLRLDALDAEASLIVSRMGGPVPLLSGDGEMASIVAPERTSELDAESRKWLEEHLLVCEGCRSLLASFDCHSMQFVEDNQALLALVCRPEAGDSLSPLQAGLPEKPSVRLRLIRFPGPRRRAVLWLAAAALLAGIVAVGLLLSSPPGGDRRVVASLANGDIRFKGSGPGLEVYLDQPEGSRRIRSRDEVHPGDRIGFRVRPELPGHLLIFGIDEADTTYLCYPQGPSGRAAVIDTARPDGLVLDQAVQFDEVLGHERIIALYCPEPFSFADLDPTLGRIRDLSSHEEAPPLRPGCQQEEIVVVKIAAQP